MPQTPCVTGINDASKGLTMRREILTLRFKPKASSPSLQTQAFKPKPSSPSLQTRAFKPKRWPECATDYSTIAKPTTDDAHGDRRLCKGLHEAARDTRHARHRLASHQEAGGPSMRANAHGAPASPQYPLRCSGSAGGSRVSHRHIMQPDPWHRKKWPRIMLWTPGKNIRYTMFLNRPWGPGLERLNENVLFSQRSRTIGHHFVAIASCSVTSMRVSPFT